MRTEYQIIPSLRLVYVAMRRAMSFKELVVHLEDLAADEDYVPPMKKIVDFSVVEDIPMYMFAQDDFDKLKTFYEGKLRGEHCVFVTPTNFKYGMGRHFGGSMGDAHLEVSVVRTLEEALALLEIKEEDFRAGLKEKELQQL